MKKLLKTILLLLLLINVGYSSNMNQKVLIVGTKVSPPFAMKDTTGEWEGISIELWKEIAKKLNLKYKFQEESLENLVNKLQTKELDLSLAALTLTSEREKVIDFTNSYYTTNLSILVPKNSSSLFDAIMDKLFSYITLYIILGLLAVVFVAGLSFWLMERKSLPKEERDNSLKGLLNGVWWATETMTTVGYGDTSPKTFGGKIVAVVWMVISMLLVALLIASLASLFTTTKAQYFISSKEDLAKGKIASIVSSTSEEFLKNRLIYPINFNNIEDAIKAVENKEADAFVYDRAILKYMIQNKKDILAITKDKFEPQNYSIALPEKSKLREDINRVMLEILESRKWQDILHKYKY